MTKHMLPINLPQIEDILRVLSSYSGRDKALRTIGFGLILISTKTKNSNLSKGLQTLSQQISQARTVCRQLNHLPLIVATRKLYDAFLLLNDRVDSALDLFIMTAYVFYQFFELAAWLGGAKIIRMKVAFWYKWAIYSWLAALIAGIVQILRRIFIVESIEDERDKSPAKNTQREVNRRINRLTLLGLAADFIAGLNLLPHKFLWAGRLSQRTSSSLFLIASIVSLYKLF